MWKTTIRHVVVVHIYTDKLNHQNLKKNTQNFYPFSYSGFDSELMRFNNFAYMAVAQWRQMRQMPHF